jgi:hypothetical protein
VRFGKPGTTVVMVSPSGADAILSPVGNEWNILAGRFYATKNGIGRKLKELAGFTDFKPSFQVPRMSGEKGAIVTASASWKMNGVPDKIEREFAVKVNSGMGSDAIIGKATRKARAWLYGYLTGSEIPDGDIEDVVGRAKNITNEAKTTGI